MAVALSIETWDFHSYTGERTPVYPLFLLLCGLDTQRVWILQSIMGVMISFLLFRIVLLLTHDPIMGFLAGLAHSLSLNVLFFEAAILAETVSTFCLILCLFLLLRNLNGAKESWISYALMGVTVGLGALVKPLLLYLPFLIACVLLFHWRIRRRPLRRVAVYLSAFLFPSFILLGGWSIFNKAAVVLTGSIVQACFESGENARYSLPFQSLMIAYVVIAVAPYFPGARFADEERRNESAPGQL